MKKLLGIIVLGLLWSNSVFGKDLRLICTHDGKNILNITRIDVVNISLGIGKAIVLLDNMNLTTGLVLETPNLFKISGPKIEGSKIVGTYSYTISRDTGEFNNEIFWKPINASFNYSGICQNKKF